MSGHRVGQRTGLHGLHQNHKISVLMSYHRRLNLSAIVIVCESDNKGTTSLPTARVLNLITVMRSLPEGFQFIYPGDSASPCHTEECLRASIFIALATGLGMSWADIKSSVPSLPSHQLCDAAIIQQGIVALIHPVVLEGKGDPILHLSDQRGQH